jgi:hypothetical protein
MEPPHGNDPGAPREESCDRARADDVEGSEDDEWLTPYAREAPMDGHCRKRKRDGKVVKRSPAWYSIYKDSRRLLKKAGLYYVGSAEDRPTLHVQKNMLDWVEVRQYQCRYFAHQLRDHGRIPHEVAECCMLEIEAVLQWMLEHPTAVQDLETGNAWLWVAMEAQQHMSLLLKKHYVFGNNETVNRWSLEGLNEEMRQKPHPKGLFAIAEQRRAVEAEEYGKRTPMQHAQAAGHFDKMLRSAAPLTEHNAVRAAAREEAQQAGVAEPPVFFERIAAAKKAQRAERGLFGELVLIDVD